MRGDDRDQSAMFSYVSPEARVPRDHPLRPIRQMVDEALRELSPRFEGLYAKTGRPSIPPEHLLRALLLQVLYTIRSERMLMEQLDYNLLFRWFVGLEMDDRVWAPTVFTKNRDRLLQGEIAQAFFEAVLQQARKRRLLSSEHFTVDGTLEAFGHATDEEAHGAIAEAERHLQALTLSAPARGDRPDQSHSVGLGELLRDRRIEPLLLVHSLVGGKEDPEALGQSPTAPWFWLEEVE